MSEQSAKGAGPHESAAHGGTAECRYCKETIKAGAIICKHCGSFLGSESPEHQGLCPFCKESIKPGATVCKHCRSRLDPGGMMGRGWGPGGGYAGWRGRGPGWMGGRHQFEHHRQW